VDITGGMAGLGGRRTALGFTFILATAVRRDEPGIRSLGINGDLAGLGERKC
jgi:hypothetical protein